MSVQDKYIRHFLKSLRPYAPERVYLFGSWAREEADELSDMDVVIIKRTPLPFLERIREVLSLLPQDMGAIDVLVYTPEEWARMKEMGNAFVEMVMEEGKLIYERETNSSSEA